MMIDDEPSWAVEAGVEGKVADPGRLLFERPLSPSLGIPCFETDLGLKQVLGETPEQVAGDKAVQIALVCQDDVRLSQRFHRSAKLSRCGACR